MIESPTRYVASPLADYDKPNYPWCVVYYGCAEPTHPTKVKGSERKSYSAALAHAEKLNSTQRKP